MEISWNRDGVGWNNHVGLPKMVVFALDFNSNLREYASTYEGITGGGLGSDISMDREAGGAELVWQTAGNKSFIHQEALVEKKEKIKFSC